MNKLITYIYLIIALLFILNMNANSEEKINYSDREIEIKKYKWEKEEFYNKVITSFEIYNKTNSRIDKLQVRFIFYDSKDSIITTKTETIKIKLNPKQLKSIKELNVGYVGGTITNSKINIIN